MDELDSIGTVVTGGLLAATVAGEGAAGRDGHSHEHDCLNCGAPLAGPFCHGCGQHAHVHRTLGAFFHDLVHGVFHVEGRTWRTLPLLAWRPGELTRRYIEGQRARFVSPMALFLFSVFLMFAVVGKLGAPVSIMNVNDGKSTKTLAQATIDAKRTEQQLVAERAALVARHQPTAAIDRQLKEQRDDLATLTAMNERGLVAAALEPSSGKARTGIRFIDDGIAKARANPSLLLFKLESSAYKYSWMLIPLSVPFLWLLFPFSARFRMYDHTVFVTYSICFMTLLVVTASILRAVGTVGSGLLVLLVPPIHMYRQLKGAYALGRGGALVRTAALLLVAIVVLALFLAAMLALGILD